MIRKINAFIFRPLLALGLTAGLVTAGPARSGQSAGISATASVVLPLGMVTTESPGVEILSTGSPAPPGSHRFWLYHPVAEGLQVQIADDVASRSSGESSVLTWLQEYPHVSLVEWLPPADADLAAGPVIVTITYTSN